MISEEQALQQILAAVRPVTAIEHVSIQDALGRVLASGVTAPMNVPGQDNSAMDGYALRVQDVAQAGVTRLPISQRIAAGATGQPLAAGTTARIFTGAPIPAGADAVVIQENCQRVADEVLIEGPLTAGLNIRRAGEDIQVGHEIMAAGTRLRPQHIGLAASVGLTTLPVFRKLKVALFFTGDELVLPGEALDTGKIYNSNRYLLLALLRQLDYELVDLGNVADDLEAIVATLETAKESADVILTCGGVSVGEEDHVRAAVERCGELLLWKIAIKPGKPIAFGKLGTTRFIGLPGNPVSAFVTFCLYARPFLAGCQGQSYTPTAYYRVPVDFERAMPSKRREYLRARIETDAKGGQIARLFAHQGSGVLSSTTWASGLICVPENQTVSRGQALAFYPFSEMFM